MIYQSLEIWSTNKSQVAILTVYPFLWQDHWVMSLWKFSPVNESYDAATLGRDRRNYFSFITFRVGM